MNSQAPPLKVSEAATALNVSKRTIYRLMGCKRLKAVDINEGRRYEDGRPFAPCWRIPQKEIDRILGVT